MSQLQLLHAVEVGASELSGTVVVLPMPSQTICRQSPGCCGGFDIVGVPGPVNAVAQLSLLQMGWWQSLVGPLQLLEVRHCTQLLIGSQN